MLKPLTLAAVLLAATAPLAYAQEDGPDRGDRYERSARSDDDMPPYRERADEDRSRDMRHGDRWARMNYEDDDRDDDRDRDRDRDREERKDRDHEDRKDKDKDRDKDKDKKRDRDRDREDGPRAERRGPDGHRGPPPPPRAGFEINMGPGQTLRVTCGDESLSDCMEAAKPILDAFAAKAGDAETRVPPPPPSLVTGDTPPPPPPAGATPAPDGATPPPPPAN